ncbi:hypothetical protein FEM48_ZijujUnG0076800 [Ziziphus jujuba var. spinosa]|uniref:non-specific serine/threonine protein kinase n=1 Tax=Ziziphus jujuba var. spinosa TaxID=714518 RepID=A0A978U8R0_ZIZJJ|nr:hypothetical protein FEM48_ZijujUnG0076800 [Ziziphus jujuba var. spinosa]
MVSRKSFIYILFCIIIHSYLVVSDSASLATIHQGNTLNSSQTLISSKGYFSLGFFSIEKYSGSNTIKTWYLGINYINFPGGTNETNRVWIANRDKPIYNDSGILTLDRMGKLMISYKGGDPIVLYKGSKFAAVNTSATLLDNGNFVLREMNSNGSAGMVLWESFAYPTDTLLPGMKLGVSHKTGQRWSLTSWLADDTPATGAFTLEWDPKGVQLVMRRQGMIYWNSGAIKRDSFGGGTFFDFVSSTSIYDLKNVTNEEEEYFTYSVNNEYDEQYRKGKSKLLLDYKGLLQDADRLQIINVEECYGYNTDDGCAKWEQPKCRGSNMKFETRSGGFTKPAGDYDMGVYDNNGSLSRSDCRAQCWNDCDCLGFRANGGTGCLFWRGKDLKFEQDYSGATVRLDLLVKSSSGESLSSKSLSWNSNASINQNIV